MKRAEQKAPHDLSAWRAFDESLSSRNQISGTSRYLKDTEIFQYALAPMASSSAPFSLRINSCESPRAPPRMDPPTFC